MNNKKTIGIIIIAIILLFLIISFAISGEDSVEGGESIMEEDKGAMMDPSASSPQAVSEPAEPGKEDSMMEDKIMASYQDISVADAKKLIDENPDLIIIDVSPRYDEGHLPGAINYYVGDGSLDRAIPSLDKEAMYLVYCHVDSASILGAEKLIEAGFPNVYRLEGNYSAWVDAGYEVAR
jgi:rhodanese-related sulfurtransferase